MGEVRLGIDLACTAVHQASLADEGGVFRWQGHKFRTTTADLEALWAKIPGGCDVVVVMEPTRNAWVAVAGWFAAKGAKVCVVAPERSAALRDYLHKHTKTDRLDSKMLATMAMLHPDGLRQIDDLGPAVVLKRLVRRRSRFLAQRLASANRLDALLELMGPLWADLLGTKSYGTTAVAVYTKYGNPYALRRLGKARLTKLLAKSSRGYWGEAKATEVLDVAEETVKLWANGGLDFAELAEDIAIEARQIHAIDQEIGALDKRIEIHYSEADPAGILLSVPGIAVTLASAILGRTGDLNRFDNQGSIRAFTGLIPKVSQSGIQDVTNGITKHGDPGLRQALFLAADLARKVDPTFAAKYNRLYLDQRKHHNSVICNLATTLITRIAACWRAGELYQLRDVDGTAITATQGRQICAERYKIDPATRQRRRTNTKTVNIKQRASQDSKESQNAPVTSPPHQHTSQAA